MNKLLDGGFVFASMLALGFVFLLMVVAPAVLVLVALLDWVGLLDLIP